MIKFASGFGIATALLFLAGCSGSGVTYGTGESHDVQTLKGMAKIFALKPEKGDDIKYVARPDLVLPANKENLPAPIANNETSDPNWPVSPEQRIATLRADAPEEDRDGNLPVEFTSDTNKTGLRKSPKNDAARIPEYKSGIAGHIDNVLADNKGVGEGAEARRRKAELGYSTGATRKYLTEPPTLYRTPSANAEAGDTGITPEDLAAQQKADQADIRKNIYTLE